MQNSIPPGKQWSRSWFFDDFPLRKTIEKVRSSFSAVWAARIAIQVSPFTARRTLRGSSEKMQPREDVRGKNENAEFCSRLPIKCGDGFRGFQSFCKVQTFFGFATCNSSVAENTWFPWNLHPWLFLGRRACNSVKNKPLIGILAAHTAENESW